MNEFEPFFHKYRNDFKKSNQEYLLWLIDVKRNKRTTINNKISMLRTYYKFLLAHNLVHQSEYINIRRLKYRRIKTLPKVYPYPLLKRIYLISKNADNFTNEERLYISLMLNHAATFNEILAIKFSNINWEKKTIYIEVKERRRIIFLQQDDLLYLTKYILDQRERINLQKSFNLFQTNGIPIKKKNLANALTKLSVYLNTKITLTGLRNTLIMYVMDLGVDTIYIKEYLGLKTLTSISRFEYMNQNFVVESKKYIDKLRVNSPVKKSANNIISNIFTPNFETLTISYEDLTKIEK